MGNKYKVYAWEYDIDNARLESYGYVEKYVGDSLFLAVCKIISLKIAKVECVKFEWR